MVLIRYGLFTPRIARFKYLIMVQQPFLYDWDSGSFVDYNRQFVGIAFAGSYYEGIICKAEYIVDKFNLPTCTQNMEI